MWESFIAFAMSDIESSKQEKGRKQLSGDKNKWLNGYDDEALGKRRSYGEPSAKAPTLKRPFW